MTGEELRNRASAVWRRIDAETDSPERETRAKATRLAYVGRDLQAARGAKAQVRSLLLVIRYLVAVIARSYGTARFAL